MNLNIWTENSGFTFFAYFDISRIFTTGEKKKKKLNEDYTCSLLPRVLPGVGGCNGTAKANQLIISRRVRESLKRLFQKGKVRKERVMH